MKCNQQVMGIQPSKSVATLPRIMAMQKADPSIINMTVGEPDFDTAKPICDEVYRQLQAGYNHYTDARGIEELRMAVAEKLNRENKIPCNKDQILITPGAKYAVYLAMQALINPGDEVMWLTPGWVSYPSIAQLCGGVPVAVHLKYDEKYRITYEALEAAASDRTKMLVINYPNNPTGRILSKDDIDAITRFLRNHPDVYLLSDEIYEKIIYHNNEVFSFASMPEFFDRTITVNGFSKCAAMTGWRVGYLACCDEIFDICLKIFQHTISCTSGFIQKGAVVALQHPEETERIRRHYEGRMKVMVEGINEIPGVELMEPDGAFYGWVKFDSKKSSNELCEEILMKAKIGGIPGEAYGEEEKCCIRFSFASRKEIQQMLINLRKFVEEGNL
ncbi:MAG: pyridoxal phosphate-dependent aminotransferase [Eubacteriales bacterium]|nr:pyridoxal phosphate-dependent aminotransferase [Eubacteriales bacterium]